MGIAIPTALAVHHKRLMKVGSVQWWNKAEHFFTPVVCSVHKGIHVICKVQYACSLFAVIIDNSHFPELSCC